MENELVDRSDIKHKINELICNKSRVNILFSNSGLGKSAVLETLLKKDQDTNCSIYVKVDTNNIMDNVACEYEFIGKILNSIKERTYNLSCPKFESIAKFEKFKSAISISLNLGIIGVGVSVPKEYHTHINRVIEAINEIETKINIHIENLEKIDWISLNYIIQIVKSTSNVMFFMECSNDSDKCQIIYNEFENQLLQPKLLILEKLEWNYVSQILCDLNLENNDEAKDEYLKLEGNIKRLIFNNKFKVKENIKIEPEPKLLLDYINICNTHLNIIEIREIIINYDTSMKKLFSMHQIYSYLEILKENDSIQNLEARQPIYVKPELVKNKVEKEKIVTDKLDVSQGKLVLGLDIDIQDEDEKYDVLAGIDCIGFKDDSNQKLLQDINSFLEQYVE